MLGGDHRRDRPSTSTCAFETIPCLVSFFWSFFFFFFFFENIAPHAPYVKKVTGKRHKPAWFWRQERPRLDIYLCCWQSEALCLLQCHGPTAAPAAPRWEAFVEKVFPLALSRLLVVPSACWSKKRVRQGSRCQAFRAAAYFSAWGRGQVFATLECKM